MHRAALALGTPRRLAEKFCHALIHAHSHRQRVAVVAISRDDMVVGAHQRAGANSHAFLADVKMEKSTHFAALVGFKGGLLESAHAHHIFEETNFFRSIQRRVNRRRGVFTVGNGFHGGWAFKELL